MINLSTLNFGREQSFSRALASTPHVLLPVPGPSLRPSVPPPSCVMIYSHFATRIPQVTGNTTGSTCPSTGTFGNAANDVSGVPHPAMSHAAPTVFGDGCHSANPTVSGRGGPSVPSQFVGFTNSRFSTGMPRGPPPHASFGAQPGSSIFGVATGSRTFDRRTWSDEPDQPVKPARPGTVDPAYRVTRPGLDLVTRTPSEAVFISISCMAVRHDNV